MSNIVGFHSPKRVEQIYDEAIGHVRACEKLIEELPDAQLCALADLVRKRTTGGNCSQALLVLQDLLFYERAGRGGRGA